jgi:hypothetical protein
MKIDDTSAICVRGSEMGVERKRRTGAEAGRKERNLGFRV